MRFDAIFEYILVSYFLSLIIQNNLVRNLLKLSIPPFVIYCLLDFFFSEKDSFRNLPVLIEFLLLIVTIIFVFFEKMKLNFQVPVYQTMNFWVLVGLFVYFSGTFFYYLLAEKYHRESERIRLELLIITSFVTILKNIILSVAVTVREPKETTEDYDFGIPLEINLDSFTPSNNLN